MPKPTPEELLLKQKKRNLLIMTNRILSGFSFKTVKTWTDAYKMMGRDTVDDKALTFKELKEFLDKLNSELDRKVSPTPEGNIVAPKPASESSPPSNGHVEAPIVIPEPVVKDAVDVKEYNYGYTRSPNESKTFFPYWFQKKAIVEGFNAIVKDKKRGVLVLAGTGTGKTFIAGGICRRLLDIHFADDLTYGPTKYLYITRATIVEQTKRVFKNKFNLTMADGVEILNIEQLRSRAGKMWVDEKMEIVDGEEIYYWTWKKNIHPPVIFLDECQAVKNEGSTQSKIIQAYSELPGARSYVVFLSATPFLRVTEAKSFVLNCHIEDNELAV